MSNLRTRSRATIIAAVAAVAACHHSPSKSSTLSADQFGVYQFSEHATAGGDAPETIDIEGTAVVLNDSVTVDARPGPCILDTPAISPYPFTYRCGNNVTLSFNRRDPVRQSAFTTRLAHNVSRQVCARYTTTANGRQTCAEFRTETTQEFVTRGGSLRLMRVPY